MHSVQLGKAFHAARQCPKTHGQYTGTSSGESVRLTKSTKPKEAPVQADVMSVGHRLDTIIASKGCVTFIYF